MTRLLLFVSFLSPLFLTAQPGYTANDLIRPYNGGFRPGINFDYYPGFTDEALANLAAGNKQLGIPGLEAKAFRPLLSEDFLETYGYDVRLNTFKYYDSLGLKDLTCITGFPSAAHQEKKEYCPGIQSAMFANLYAPIWDNGANGTPVNDTNYFALYIYKMVTRYKGQVKFWEVWNEPGYDYTGARGWLPRGSPGNWWDNNPDPCDYKLRAPIFNYVRMLRIAYEVIKTIDPDAKVCTSGLGFPSFLDAILRNTDNPNNGQPSADYPLSGGAYFDVLIYHSYPHFDGSLRAWNNARGAFDNFRHSDAAARGIDWVKQNYQDVFDQYGYNGNKYPGKLWLITECNLPRKQFGDFIGSTEAQRNFMIKGFIQCVKSNVIQWHIFKIAENTDLDHASYEFDVMGLYKKFEVAHINQQDMNDEGVAYKTASLMMFGKRYDTARTRALLLPAGADGAAFKDSSGVYTYVLWAKTTIDQSEAASATYSFPANLPNGSFRQRNWDYSKTLIESQAPAQQIALTGSPIFLTEQTAGANKYAICVGDSVMFTDGTGSASREWTIVTGLGQTSKDTARQPVRTYYSPGTYPAVLTAKDANGVIFSQQTINIQVADAPVVNFSYAVSGPTVTVTNLSGANVDSLAWDFGDGSKSATPNTSHLYFKSGIYSVKLTAFGRCGQKSTVQQVTIAAPAPPAVTSTANDAVPAYTGGFHPGVNLAYAPGWLDQQIADIAAGSANLGLPGVGAKSLRISLPDNFVSYWGVNVRKDAFDHYGALGLTDNILTVGSPAASNQDLTSYCPTKPSALFKNMYADIWDGGANGTPVNDDNAYALYIYNLVTTYKGQVKFWEIWDTPGYDETGKKGWLARGAAGNWWENNPAPCDYALHAPIFNLVRLMRISYEVIKSVDPNAIVTFSGAGFPSFLDAVCRNTDNPSDGSAQPSYPFKGGAYFDAVTYNSFPIYDGSTFTVDAATGVVTHHRTSDAGAQGIVSYKNQLTDVLKTYGYDGSAHPAKYFLVGQANIPRKALNGYFGNEEIQKNYVVKAYALAAANGIVQLDIQSVAENQTPDIAGDPSQVEGLYEKLGGTPYQAKKTLEGVAFKTASDALYGLQPDPARTLALALPSGVKGSAFKNVNGKYTYVLWAETTTDLSETASATYAFPAGLTASTLYQKNWDFSETKLTQAVDPTQVALTGSPVFLSGNSAGLDSTAVVTGTIATEIQKPVENVTVAAYNSANVPFGLQTTSSDGTYKITGLKNGDHVDIRPYKNTNPGNGVSTYDLTLISNHILGVQLLNSPYKIIAADVNKDAEINAVDLLIMRKMILHIIDQFPGNTSWRFVNKDYQFPHPNDPFSEVLPGSINVNAITAPATVNFIAIKVGDVNNSAVTNSVSGITVRHATETLTFGVDEQAMTAGREYTVHFTLSQLNALGYQFTVNFTKGAVEILDVTPGALNNLTESNFGKFENAVTTSWNGTASGPAEAFSITIRAKANAKLSDVLTVGSNLTTAEAYGADGEVMNVQLKFNTGKISGEEFMLYQNEPNPALDYTKIGFNLPQSDKGTLTVYDVSGRVLTVRSGDFNKGYNEVRLTKAELGVSGVLFYRLDTPDHSAIKKMIVLE